MGTMRRGLGWALALGLLVGGAAACSDDDDGGDSATETTAAGGGGDSQESTTTAAGGGDEESSSGSGAVPANDAVIQEYCDAKEVYNALLDDSLTNPDDAGLQDQLRDASGRLGEASDAIAPVVEAFTPEQQAQFEECESA
jgi:hypothetical protein